jgi:uncharacterized protein
MRRRSFVIAGTATVLGAAMASWSRAKRRGLAPDELGEARLPADPRGLLDLREGFSYRVLQRTGDRMSDGFRVPGRPDAMGCFDLGRGRWALMRNHELDTSLLRLGPYPPGSKAPHHAYDSRYIGGVSRVVLDPTGRVLSSNLVLTGTARNCAGGMSPWGWLSCEESVETRHGFVFLCSTRAERLRAPQRIPAYGRFQHEAVAIDPSDHAAYLTEDRSDGCLYRFVPRDRDEPFGRGKLQAMAIHRRPRFALGDTLPHGAKLRLSWVDVPPEAGDDDDLRHVAQARGAAIVTRGEGIWRVDDGFVFTSTTGGPGALGQIFHFAPSTEGGTLKLIAQATDARTFDMPDNITVTPWGDLLACEDNHRAPHLRIITRSGHVVPFAFNRGSASEFAGVCFSPDGRLLFVNIQEQGLTLAIEGPWHTLATS